MKLSSPLSTLLVDDHPVYRSGLAKVISNLPMIGKIAEAGNGREAISMVEQEHFDILFLDISMPDINGIEVAKYLISHSHNIKIIVNSQSDNQHYVRELMELGVDGYILKSAGLDELNQAILQVMAGKTYYSSEVSAAWKKHCAVRNTRTSAATAIKELSKREVEIMKLFCIGKNADEIGEKLFIEASTVNTHKQRIMKKIGVHETVDMVKYALKHKYIDLEAFLN